MTAPYDPTARTPAPPLRSRRPALRAIAAIAFVLSIVSWGAAGNTSLRVDDSDVDYTDHECEEVYPALAFDVEEGTLMLSFHAEPSGATLPAIAFDIPDLEREDFWGEEIGARIGDIQEVGWSAGAFDNAHSIALDGATYRHTHTTVGPVVDAYVQAFTELGFAAEILDTVSAGFKVGTFTHGEHRIRVDFRRDMSGGNRVVVELKVL